MKLPFITESLPAAVESKLRELEWNLTNPYDRLGQPVDLDAVKAVLSAVPESKKLLLFTREFNFFDDGCTTVDIHDTSYMRYRADAIVQIKALYWEVVKEKVKALIRSGEMTQECLASYLERAKKHWYQKTFLEYQLKGNLGL